MSVLDLRDITRGPHTTVIQLGHGRQDWIYCGVVCVRFDGAGLSCRGPEGVKDNEGHSIHVLSLPLVGIQPVTLESDYMEITGFIGRNFIHLPDEARIAEIKAALASGTEAAYVSPQLSMVQAQGLYGYKVTIITGTDVRVPGEK